MAASQPTEIRARKAQHELHIEFDDGAMFDLPFQYLRAFSPSAEVTGHDGTPRLVVAVKEGLDIKAIEPVGQYAIRIVFDDGHDSGLYTWRILRDLGENFEKNWREYTSRLERSRMRKGASHVE